MTGEPINQYIVEYLNRKRLSELGYTYSSSELACDKAEAFLIISSAIDEYQAKKMKAKK